ncbi:RpnC/YadD family protein [Spirosoma gilvum]
MSKQASQYDKIFKENIEAVLPILMQNILGITAIESEELPDDVQHTKERKPDLLKKITDAQGATFVLHIEFQLVDEPEMVYRMAEYFIMLVRKHKTPVRQFVIFLGANQPQMPTQIDVDFLRFRFPLISFNQLDYQLFLKASKPEEILLAVLADFNNTNPEKVLKRIIERIEETTEGDFSLMRYFRQLRVLAQLRNLELTLKNTMDSIAKFISEERDVLYLRGFDKGEERIVKNLLTKLSWTAEEIANVAGVSVEFVRDVQQKLKDAK